MIGFLRGTLEAKQPPLLVVDVQGVGYEVEAPMSTFYHLPAVGQPVRLLTHLVVREDAQLLYGFLTESERALFRALIKVNGVGPKLALTILSGIEASEFGRCVADGNTSALTRLPGVGKKTAERLIVEMRDKAREWLPKDAPDALEFEDLPVAMAGDARSEAESALIALGYKPAQAARVVAEVARELPDASPEDLIRQALRSMAG